MPKKSSRRSTKARNRVRRPAPVASNSIPLEVEEIPSVETARATEQPAPRSRGRAPARRVAPIVDYGYLSRDLRSLAVLAPLMVVLVLISFVFLR